MSSDHDYRTGRLRQKYIITKVDGSPIDPEARYFVLRYDEDPHARDAVIAYVNSIWNVNRELAYDLNREIIEIGAELRRRAQRSGTGICEEEKS